jgi:hypothetical protein
MDTKTLAIEQISKGRPSAMVDEKVGIAKRSK